MTVDHARPQVLSNTDLQQEQQQQQQRQQQRRQEQRRERRRERAGGDLEQALLPDSKRGEWTEGEEEEGSVRSGSWLSDDEHDLEVREWVGCVAVHAVRVCVLLSCRRGSPWQGSKDQQRGSLGTSPGQSMRHPLPGVRLC